MASVVAHHSGSWEIRESLRTAQGPRSRTLASFRVLTPQVLEHARARAQRPFDAAAIERAARRKGVAVANAAEQEAALTLLSSREAGAAIAPGLRALLREALAAPDTAKRDQEPSPQAQAAIAWARASAADRGDALVDLLLLADALPAPPERPQRFPRLQSRPVSGSVHAAA